MSSAALTYFWNVVQIMNQSFRIEVLRRARSFENTVFQNSNPALTCYVRVIEHIEVIRINKECRIDNLVVKCMTLNVGLGDRIALLDFYSIKVKRTVLV